MRIRIEILIFAIVAICGTAFVAPFAWGTMSGPVYRDNSTGLASPTLNYVGIKTASNYFSSVTTGYTTGSYTSNTTDTQTNTFSSTTSKTQSQTSSYTYTATASNSGSDDQSNLLGYWKLNGNLNDSIGTHNGVFSTTGTSTISYTAGSGCLNCGTQGVHLDGVDEGISIATGSNLIATSTSFTVSAWVLPTGTSVQGYIVNYYPSSEGGGWRFRQAANGTIRLDKNGAGAAGSNQKLVANTWQFIAGSYGTASPEWRVYYNGQTTSQTGTGTATFASGGANNTYNQNIGFSTTGSTPSNFFNGSVQEVHYYNRALSAAEIQNLYNCNMIVSCSSTFTTTSTATNTSSTTATVSSSATQSFTVTTTNTVSATQSSTVTSTFASIVLATTDTNYALNIQSGPMNISGAQILTPTYINSPGPYNVTATDYLLQVKYTATGAITINLPAVATGRNLIIKDSGYSSGTHNITLHPAGSTTINGVAGDYTLSSSGVGRELHGNASTNDWQFIGLF